jgi:hypothetical protein
MTSKNFIAELEQLNLKRIEIVKRFMNNLQEYFPNENIVITSPNALMKYLTKALDKLAFYIDHNKKAAESDPNLKFNWEKAISSYSQLQKVLKELRSRHSYDGIWNRILGKGGKFK